MELHGVGCYAADAYTIFHLGHWRDAKVRIMQYCKPMPAINQRHLLTTILTCPQPADKDLKNYVKWLEATGG